MKKKNINLGKLNLNKMTISSLQSVKGGVYMSGDGCDSKDTYCNSMATAFTDYKECCGPQQE
jgi:hypothetical protein